MGTHPIFESDFDCLTDFGYIKMKYLHHSQEVTVDEGVTCEVKARVVTVTSPRGTLTKSFRHLKVEMKSTGPRSILVEKWMGSSKDKAAVRTVCSHISNLSKGVTLGFRYKLRAAYAHFPINCTVVDGGSTLEVRNFLGEKFLRKVNMAPGVSVEISRHKRMDFMSMVTTSRTYQNRLLEFNSQPPSRTRISESSWMDFTFRKRPPS